MNRMFSIIVNYNKCLSIRNSYNTNTDYFCECFITNNIDTNEITKTN